VRQLKCFVLLLGKVAPPDQEKAIMRQIIGFREQIGRTLHEQQILPARPLLSAQRALLTAILFAELAIEDLRPKKLKGYGEVSPASALELEDIVLKMSGMMHKIGAGISDGVQALP
jgi:hypothetical protein